MEPGRSQVTIWRMRIACWIPKSTSTSSEYVYSLIFHGKSGYANAPKCYVCTYVVCLVFVVEHIGPTRETPMCRGSIVSESPLYYLIIV